MLPKNNLNIRTGKVLFDASALLALIKREPGHDILEGLLASSCISAVNLSEVITVLTRIGVSPEEIAEIISVIPEVIDFTQNVAVTAGNLSNITKEFGLSLGDRSCIATAIKHNMTVYTTDQVWIKLNIEGLNIAVAR
jgi:ribonuclease VapC